VTDDRLQRIHSALEVLKPASVSLRDDSHRHAGHAGARDGRGHFSLSIVSAQFEGLSPIKRHRAVYAALSGLLESDIHALAIQARTPEEAAKSQTRA
jgi:BolA family transcriptional regulator, general stress-responsive regulator